MFIKSSIVGRKFSASVRIIMRHTFPPKSEKNKSARIVGPTKLRRYGLILKFQCSCMPWVYLSLIKSAIQIKFLIMIIIVNEWLLYQLQKGYTYLLALLNHGDVLHYVPSTIWHYHRGHNSFLAKRKIEMYVHYQSKVWPNSSDWLFFHLFS